MTTHGTDFLIREGEAEYRAKAMMRLTGHALADFRRCPLLYWKKQRGLVPDEDRPPYLVGRAACEASGTWPSGYEGVRTFDYV